MWLSLFHASHMPRLHHPHEKSNSHPWDSNSFTLDPICPPLQPYFLSSKHLLPLWGSAESLPQALWPKSARSFSSLEGGGLKERAAELVTSLRKY